MSEYIYEKGEYSVRIVLVKGYYNVVVREGENEVKGRAKTDEPKYPPPAFMVTGIKGRGARPEDYCFWSDIMIREQAMPMIKVFIEACKINFNENAYFKV